MHPAGGLRRNGWSVQVPGRRAVERDDQAVQVWKERVWPQVEPSRATWAPGSVSRARPVKGSSRPGGSWSRRGRRPRVRVHGGDHGSRVDRRDGPDAS
ncbi:winged helix-turn-helix domain-containing protein [Actinomadura roseirufa]|uniref:winged helix-turn-helix domain-containing protein n=1 Tax=Actinomadura roseirufa TaxID=2094049 RepID=UPI003F97DFF1